MSTKLWSGRQSLEVLRLIDEKCASLERLQSHLKRGHFVDLLEADPEEVDRDELRRVLKLEPFFPEPTIFTFTLRVNYDLTVEELVPAGKYDDSNPSVISQNFPSSRTGIVELECAYFYFNCVMKLAKVHPVLGNRGYRRSELKELLTVGIDRPYDQRQFPIIDTGSVWDGDCPSLDGASWCRRLILFAVARGCPERCRFLAVRESSRP